MATFIRLTLEGSKRETFVNFALVRHFHSATLHSGSIVWFSGDEDYINVLETVIELYKLLDKVHS